MTLRIAAGLSALSGASIVAAWAWLGAEVAMPALPSGAQLKPYCLSYAPFRGRQTPLDLATRIEARQIRDDLMRIKAMTDCVRTYSNDFGIDQVPAVAQEMGLKVIQGLWLSSHADRSREQVATAITLARKYPDTIRAIVVGNEVLLRGEMSAQALADTIQAVKQQVSVPVTYADVWEFWLRNRELADLVDFVTVHILPYWEDFPIPAERAAAHVGAIRARVAAAFPGKEVLIGETGWPSQGRMREGALPSPTNQALVLHRVLALAQRQNFRVNIIEAFDQPWKRHLEGTVGGYWGVFDDPTRQPKFAWGGSVSNHPDWRWQAAGGAALAVVVFAAGMAGTRGRRGEGLGPGDWAGIMLSAVAGGIFTGWALESMLVEGFGLGGWLVLASYVVLSVAAPIAGGAALAGKVPLPSFAAMLGRADTRPGDPLALALGAILIGVVVLALQSALGLAFDPRYRDFPDAALTAIVLPLLALSVQVPATSGRRGAAEVASAAVLGLAAVYIVVNEGLANWQAIWFGGMLAILAIILLRVRGAPG
jgi:glucan 1,3-beta-glucosidase